MKPVDWRTIENYPGLAPHWANTSRRWAWEFMRRNAEYETDRERWRVVLGDGSHQTGEAYQVRRELADKWGVTCRVCWPESDEPQGWQLFIFGLHGLIGFSGADATPDSPRRSGAQWEEYLQVRRNEVWIRFDLEEKLDHQLSNAKKYLKDVREHLKITAPTHRLRKPEKLQQYLRAWDAAQAGTARSDIAAVLYPEVKNCYPDFAGSDQVSKDSDTANELIDFGFLALSINTEFNTVR